MLNLPLEVFTKKICSRLYSTEIEILKTKNRFLGHPLGDYRG